MEKEIKKSEGKIEMTFEELFDLCSANHSLKNYLCNTNKKFKKYYNERISK